MGSLDKRGTFLRVFNFVGDNTGAPFGVFNAILTLVVLASIVRGTINGRVGSATAFTAITTVSLILLDPVCSIVATSISTLGNYTLFVATFIPIFTTIVTTSKGTLDTTSVDKVLLVTTGFMACVSDFTMVPLVAKRLSLDVTSSISPLLRDDGLTNDLGGISL